MGGGDSWGSVVEFGGVMDVNQFKGRVGGLNFGGSVRNHICNNIYKKADITILP